MARESDGADPRSPAMTRGTLPCPSSIPFDPRRKRFRPLCATRGGCGASWNSRKIPIALLGESGDLAHLGPRLRGVVRDDSADVRHVPVSQVLVVEHADPFG